MVRRTHSSAFTAAFGVALLTLSGCSDEPAADPGSGTDADTETDGPTSTTTEGESDTDTDAAPAEPPPTPILVSPTDAALDIEPTSSLCWEPVEDPNGDEVRYRVFVDDIELDQGKGAEVPGHAGPCLENLDFNPGQTFEWTVQAFEVEDPTSESERAQPWSFTTLTESGGQVIYEEDFDEEDHGWTVEGDATSGAWEHGDPNGAEFDGESSQPNNCYVGNGCFFTGQNPEAMPSQEDVEGGSTVLLSPEFDLTGFSTASVTLSRFFFKELEQQTGTELRIELLTPNEDAPDGYDSVVLEALDQRPQISDSNVWMPTEFAACAAPMVENARLRITATDLGHVYGDEGITEAAIDEVQVIGHPTTELCDGGSGSICDPAADNACAEGFMCCPQGTVHTGIYRCSVPVAGLDYDNPATDGIRNGEVGCDAPDLRVLDPTDTVLIDTINVGEAPGEHNYCVWLEGCVDGPGERTVLRFDTSTPNQGSRDLVMGVPSNHPDLFHFSECHGHHHFDGYAFYELLDDEENVVATGHKQAFCLMDTGAWAEGFGDGMRWCGNQGISMGYQDDYGRFLDCQWIDITDVDAGDYTLHIAVNLPDEESGVARLVERDYSNNEFWSDVTIP